jgi:hypothetical protein
MIALVKRLQRMPLKRVLRLLRRTRVDQYLYANDQDSPIIAHAWQAPLRVERYSASRKTGDAALDRKLGGETQLFQLLDGDRVIHKSWVFYDVMLLGQFGYPGGKPVIGDCWTDPACRGRRIYPHMLSWIYHELRAEGETVVYILVAPDNIASIKGIEHAGFLFQTRVQGDRLLGLMLRKTMSGKK